MNRAELIAVLKTLEPEIRSRGVSALYLYGSYARDAARPDSDIDILVDFEAGRGEGLVAYLSPYELIEERFPDIEIGYGSIDGLALPYRPFIEESAVRIF